MNEESGKPISSFLAWDNTESPSHAPPGALQSHRLARKAGCPGKVRTEKAHVLSKAVWCYQMSDGGWDFRLLCSKAFAHLVYRGLAFQGPSLLWEAISSSIKETNAYFQYHVTDHLHLFTDILHPAHLQSRFKSQPKPSESEGLGLKYLNVNFTSHLGNSVGLGITENH